jgi:predicted nucleic acid-binding protein
MIEPLRRASAVCFDTAALIYFIERNPKYVGLARPLFAAIDRGDKTGITSYITLLEVLVKPLLERRNDLAKEYRQLLLGSPSLHLHAVDRHVAEEAARIRATHNFKTPDAIQLATAKLAKADVFVTNDARLKAFPDVPVVVLEEHLGG